MNLAYGVVLKLIESSEGRLVLKLYKLMMDASTLASMDRSVYAYVPKVGTVAYAIGYASRYRSRRS